MTEDEELNAKHFIGIRPVAVADFIRDNPNAERLMKPIQAMRKPIQGVVVDLDFHVSWVSYGQHHCRCFGTDELAAFRFAQALAIVNDIADC